MTTNTDTKKPLSPQKSEPKPQTSTPKKRLSPYGVTMAAVILALGCALYAITTNLTLRKSTDHQLQTLGNQIAALKQQLVANNQFDTTIRTINKSHDQLQNKLNAVDKQLQSALRERLYQSNDWLLQKARYYLELAQISAQWSNNLQTTTALLQQADALLANIHDQRVLNIRQVISKEITTIQAIPTIDAAGILSQLEAAGDAISNLTLSPPVRHANKKNTSTTNKKSTSTWREGFRESISLLANLVVVRHRNEDIPPLASPAYESIRREEIRLNLQEAAWAVLQHNEPIYQLSLTAALNTIKRSFAPDAHGTHALVQQLQSLLNIPLTQQKPILEQSLPLLNQLIESKGALTTDVKPTAAGELSK